MKRAGLRVGRLSGDDLDQILRRAREAEPTYDHVGSTLDPRRWDGPAVRIHHIEVGRGETAFVAARTALATWVPQLALGADPALASHPVALGGTVLVVLRRGPVQLVVPNRIVTVIDEPRRFAYAYGTLPGHSERGEESFMVEWLGDGSVRATIRLQASAGTRFTRAVAPVVRRLQTAAARRYLRAVAAHVAGRSAPS